MKINIRFWQFINGDWVKLTLKPGDVLEHYICEPHEEGWSSRHQVWEFDGHVLWLEEATDGRDCDGRMSSHDMYKCNLLDVRRRQVNDFDNKDASYSCPYWMRESSSQRDYAAEAMGY